MRLGLCLRFAIALLALFLVASPLWSYGGRVRAHTTYVPLVAGAPAPPADECDSLPDQSYCSLTVNGAPTVAPAAEHPDLNPALRGYTAAVGQYVGLIDNCYTRPDDAKAPQLRGLFADHRKPTVLGVYWIYQWDWNRDRPATAVENTWGPSFVTLATTPCEILSVPPSGYEIDGDQGLEVLVLYAGEDWITLKYTREDNVLYGYTLHLQGVWVDPALLALYNTLEAAGRDQLPALRAGQPFARARGTALGLSIRDCGGWMDPRNCADWWRQ